MNREIKFRAWHKNTKTMYDVAYIHFDTGMIGCLVTIPGEKYRLLQPMDKGTYELLEYTGLKGRNGVEIFEGDITEFHQDKPTHWMAEDDMAKGRTRKIVTWCEGKFHCNPIESDLAGDVFNWHATTKTSDLEVIGNIYEHPELLK